MVLPAILTQDNRAALGCKTLSEVAKLAASCMACALHTGRTCSVFLDGNPQAKIMIIGEGPGQNEDETGVPFVGRAGQLLTQMIESVGFNREADSEQAVYICNVVKCRPPQNRAPLPEEIDTCFPFLAEQIRLVQPKIILLAGATAVKAVLKTKVGITKIRGQWFEVPDYLKPLGLADTKIMPIFHPSYLLRNQSKAEGSPQWLMRQDAKEIRRAFEVL